jgi:hypothetical protein
MKAVLFVSASALISGIYAQTFTINTPGQLSECEPALISWTGGQPPYFLSVYPQSDPSTTVENLGELNSTSFTWIVNVASGQSVGFNLLDSTGAEKQTAAVPIQAGVSTSCVGQAASGSAGSAGTTGSNVATGATGGSTSTGSSGSATTTGSSGGASTSAGTSAATSASASTTSNAASAQSAQLGAAGILGAALLAFLA